MLCWVRTDRVTYRNLSSTAAVPPPRVRPFHPSVIAVHACDLSLRCCAERGGGLGLSEVGREDIEKNIPLLRHSLATGGGGAYLIKICYSCTRGTTDLTLERLVECFRWPASFHWRGYTHKHAI